MRKTKQSPQSGGMESQEVQYQFHLPVDIAKVMVQAYAQAFTDAVSAYRHRQPSVEGSQLEQQARNGLEKLKAMVGRKPITNDLELLAHILVRTYVSAYQKESRLLVEVPSYAERWRQLLSGGDRKIHENGSHCCSKRGDWHARCDQYRLGHWASMVPAPE